MSDRFPSLNPLTLRATPMAEFCRLASCVLDHERRRRRAERRKDRRPAGDSWFRNPLSRTARIMAGRGQNPFREPSSFSSARPPL